MFDDPYHVHGGQRRHADAPRSGPAADAHWHVVVIGPSGLMAADEGLVEKMVLSQLQGMTPSESSK